MSTKLVQQVITVSTSLYTLYGYVSTGYKIYKWIYEDTHRKTISEEPFIIIDHYDRHHSDIEPCSLKK